MRRIEEDCSTGATTLQQHGVNDGNAWMRTTAETREAGSDGSNQRRRKGGREATSPGAKGRHMASSPRGEWGNYKAISEEEKERMDK
jgi:hypothetical protein